MLLADALLSRYSPLMRLSDSIHAERVMLAGVPVVALVGYLVWLLLPWGSLDPHSLLVSAGWGLFGVVAANVANALVGRQR